MARAEGGRSVEADSTGVLFLFPMADMLFNIVAMKLDVEGDQKMWSIEIQDCRDSDSETKGSNSIKSPAVSASNPVTKNLTNDSAASLIRRT